MLVHDEQELLLMIDNLMQMQNDHDMCMKVLKRIASADPEMFNRMVSDGTSGVGKMTLLGVDMRMWAIKAKYDYDQETRSKVGLIKDARQETGAGLREAKQFVDLMLDGMRSIEI